MRARQKAQPRTQRGKQTDDMMLQANITGTQFYKELALLMGDS